MNIFIIGYRILNYGFLKHKLYSIMMALIVFFNLFTTRTFMLDSWVIIFTLILLVVSETIQIAVYFMNKPILELFISKNKDFETRPADVSWELSIFCITITIVSLIANIITNSNQMLVATSVVAWIGIWLSILARAYFHDYVKNAQLYLHMLTKEAFKNMEEKNVKTDNSSSN